MAQLSKVDERKKKSLDFHLQVQVWYVTENSRVGHWKKQSINDTL